MVRNEKSNPFPVWRSRIDFNELSAAEKRVMVLMGMGYSDKTIAAMLSEPGSSLTPRTVRFHADNIIQKTGAWEHDDGSTTVRRQRIVSWYLESVQAEHRNR